MDSSFPCWDRTPVPYIGKQILNLWAAREVLRGVILVAFSDDLTECSLIIHQSSTSDGFAKVHCQLESEITSVTSDCYIKSMGPSGAVTGSATQARFCSIKHWSFGNTGPQSCANLPNTDTWNDYAKLKDHVHSCHHRAHQKNLVSIAKLPSSRW